MAPLDNTQKLLASRGWDLFSDGESLDRIARVVSLDQDIAYDKAITLLLDTWETERTYVGPGRTVANVLERMGIDQQTAQEGLQLLERKDEHQVRTLDDAYGQKLLTEPVDAQGHVSLAPGFDSYAALNDPRTKAERLDRVRKAGARTYEGEAGERRFAADDASFIGGGKDLVRSYERPHELRAAQAKANGAIRKFDSKFTNTSAHREKVKLLDAEIEDLRVRRAEVTGGVQARSPGQIEAEKLLEQSVTTSAERDQLRARAMAHIAKHGLDPERDYVKAYEAVSALSAPNVLRRLQAIAPASIPGAEGDEVTPSAPRPDAYDPEDERLDSDKKVQAYMAAHPGCDYMEATEAVSGFEIPR